MRITCHEVLRGCVDSIQLGILAAGFLMLLTISQRAMAEPVSPEWPQVSLPDGVSVFPIGDTMIVGGMPVRVVGFVSGQPPTRLLPSLRRSLGQPLVESNSGDRRVLGRAEGRFYITVQVIPSGEGSRGILSIADREARPADTGPADSGSAGSTRWREALPSGSTVSSDVVSSDAGKTARHVVVINGHDELVNRDAILGLMKQEGYQLDREARADTSSRRAMRTQFADSTALYFTGPSKNAVAVIVRDGGHTALVINIVTTLPTFR